MKLVVTGPPDSGKTTLVHTLECQFPQMVAAVPDAMDALNRQFIPESKSKTALKSLQIALYQLQLALEDLYFRTEQTLCICDRGTLDGLMSWPESPKSFFHAIHSSLEDELGRYDWVIELTSQLPHQQGASTANPSQGPILIWRQHPRHLSVSLDGGFSTCIMTVSKMVEKIMAGHSYEEVLHSGGLPLKAASPIHLESSPVHAHKRPLI